MSNVFKSYNVFFSPQEVVVKKDVYRQLLKIGSKMQGNPPEGKKGEAVISVHEEAEDILKKARKEAEEIISIARSQAEEIICSAQNEAEKIKEEARAEGFQEGFKEGFNEGMQKTRQEFQDKMHEVEELKKEITREKERIFKSCETEMVNLAIDIARKILEERLDEDEGVYLKIVQKVLKKVKGEKSIQLRVSNIDYPLIIKMKDFILSRVDGVEDINIVKDASLKRGSCIVDSEKGTIDGSIETQIAQIKAAFDFITNNYKQENEEVAV